MTTKNKVLTQYDLRNIIKEESQKFLKEYEQYVDEDGNVWDDEGNVSRRGKDFGRRYGGETYGLKAPWSGRRASSSRKTSYVGSTANTEQIAAVEAALEAKSNNFLESILSQLKAGRGLSAKQKGIVKKILQKVSPDLVSLFEGKVAKKPVVDESWLKIINEYYEDELHPDHIDGQPWSGTLEDFAKVQSKTFGGGDLAHPDRHQKLISTGREMAKASTKKETSGK